MMTLKELKSLGQLLTSFLGMFADCFSSVAGRGLFRIYVQGQLSDIRRKNCEAMALKFRKPARTLQRFLESIKWDEQKLRDRTQQIVARDHAHDEAIGTVDESGIAKSGRCTAAVTRQYNGNRGKVENCVNNVALAYSAPGFDCLLDARLYLPEEWAEDPARRKKTTFPTTWSSKQSHRSRWT
jgi:SRSO17 transposase